MPSKTTRSDESLPVRLTDEERLSKADELANVTQETERAIENKKITNAQLTGEVRVLEATRNNIANIVASGQEYRKVPVETKVDWNSGKLRKTRLDTGEVYFERNLTEHEKQLEILDEGE